QRSRTLDIAEPFRPDFVLDRLHPSGDAFLAAQSLGACRLPPRHIVSICDGLGLARTLPRLRRALPASAELSRCLPRAFRPENECPDRLGGHCRNEQDSRPLPGLCPVKGGTETRGHALRAPSHHRGMAFQGTPSAECEG